MAYERSGGWIMWKCTSALNNAHEQYDFWMQWILIYFSCIFAYSTGAETAKKKSRSNRQFNVFRTRENTSAQTSGWHRKFKLTLHKNAHLYIKTHENNGHTHGNEKKIVQKWSAI